MTLTTEQDVIDLVMSDTFMVRALKTAAELDLKDWWLASGCVRNLVWDHICNKSTPTPLNDIDMIYFDPDQDRSHEVGHETWLNDRMVAPWSVRNQAFMHIRNDDQPYKNCHDAMAHWLERIAAVAIRLDPQGLPVFTSVFDLEDLLTGIVQPTPHCNSRADRRHEYNRRLVEKSWDQRWPGVRVIPAGGS